MRTDGVLPPGRRGRRHRSIRQCTLQFAGDLLQLFDGVASTQLGVVDAVNDAGEHHVFPGRESRDPARCGVDGGLRTQPCAECFVGPVVCHSAHVADRTRLPADTKRVGKQTQ